MDLDVIPESHLQGPGEWNPSVEVLRGLLTDLDPHARRIVLALSQGQTKKMAALSAGCTPVYIYDRIKKDRVFSTACDVAETIGVAGTLERELYRRAMAGADDRGSMRALEIALKARSPEYREKSQVQHEIITRAQEATGSLTGGWQALPEPD